ncbi:helix-turn-helix transcriptional regulator [Paucibacter soli]|uniref:helix-turn-helix transcriptional regulator n=1 Tax=Paucibacter soli TaxID=3133433 RepID=UPI0030A9D57A
MNSTSERLLYQLKSRGPQSAATLAAACAITPMGAHKQLQGLLAQGLVEAEDEAGGGAGRPKRIWRLSAAGHGRFPDRHGELAVQLIRQTAELLGPAVLEQLIAAREREMLASYRQRLAGARSLPARLRRLAELRAEEGYLARVERDGGDWLLIEDHCPICAAATSCQGFCRSELALFRALLGPQAASVERCEHLLQAGARRCAYRIRAAASARQAAQETM